MKPRAVFIVLPFFIMLSLFSCAVSAEESKEKLKEELTNLRNKKAEMTLEYKNGLREAQKECDDKLTDIKSRFRISRQECLDARYEKSENLRKNYENKLKPMLKEEDRLVELIGRDAREDFARTRVERRAGKK